MKHKRKREQARLEIPCSDEDENYGWADDDASSLPPLPPQWQGSEDILLGNDMSQSDEENEERGRDADELGSESDG